MKEKFLKKVNIFNFTVFVVSIILIVIVIYYGTLFLPKSIKIETSEKLNEEMYIEQITQGKYKTQIEIRVNLNVENLQKYRNYISGEGEGYYINYSVILQDGEKQHKIRTMFKGIEDGQAIIIGYVLTNFYNKKDYQIGILQKNYKDEKEITRFGIIDNQAGETNE